MVGHSTIGWHQVCYDCHFELKYQFLDFNNDEALNQSLQPSLLIFKIICSGAGKHMNKNLDDFGRFFFCLLCLLYILKRYAIDLKINRICPLTTPKKCTTMREGIINCGGTQIVQFAEHTTSYTRSDDSCNMRQKPGNATTQR